MVTLHCHLPDARLMRDVGCYVLSWDDVPPFQDFPRNTLYLDIGGADLFADGERWKGDAFTILPERARTVEKRNGLVVSVRFLPGGPSRLLGLDASAHLGFFGNGTELPHPALEAAAEAARDAGEDPGGVFAALDRVFLEILPDCEREAEAEWAHAQILARPLRGFRIADLADEAGISLRSLQRAYRRRYGVTMARDLRIRRFFTCIHRASGRKPAWRYAPPQSAYVDQSHFLRDARQLVGVLPDALGQMFRTNRLFYPRGVFRRDCARGDPRLLPDWRERFLEIPGSSYWLSPGLDKY